MLLRSRGVEWFIYNRSPAYDAVLQSIRNADGADHRRPSPRVRAETKPGKQAPDAGHQSSAGIDHKQDIFSLPEKKEIREAGKDGNDDDLTLGASSTNSSAPNPNQSPNALPRLLNLLPVRIECSKGAIVMGNRSTRSILTAKFDKAVGQLDARTSRSCDQYKQIVDFDFIHPIVEFKRNKDYMDVQANHGVKVQTNGTQGAKEWIARFRPFKHRNRIRDAWTSIRDFAPYHRGSVESLNQPRLRSAGPSTVKEVNAGAYGKTQWLGLTRYLDADDDLIEQERWKAIEYGSFPTIVDSPAISMSFYWDVPGLVPDPANIAHQPSPDHETNINGDVPPDWGIDLKIRGGTINYGPWADRQRADIQAVFFPTLYKGTVPAAMLLPGQPRISTEMKVIIEVEEQITLRIPTREDSKDWRWKGRPTGSAVTDVKQKKKDRVKGKKGKEISQTPEVRPFGWLDIKVLPDSTVNIAMDLVARINGYSNHINLDLKGIEMLSSVNHGLLWRSQSQTISCDLSNPLDWNTLRQWHVDIKDNGLELFMLRDHMFLLTDLINDWTSGPSGEFHTFVPFVYSISLSFTDFKLHLNANDSNIINSPADIDDNTFVTVWGQDLEANLVIPAKTFCPTRNRVTFGAEAHGGGFELRTPPRNTQHTFLNSSGVAGLKDLKIDGVYTYFTTTSPSLTDVLHLNVHGNSPRINMHGFLIRYLMKIKDNYFGDDIHFRTLEEYQSQMNDIEGHVSEESTSGQHSRLSNDLDVIMSITAKEVCALLPAHLYSSDKNTRLELSSIAADLRLTNYFMDFAVSSSPIAISHKCHSHFCKQGSESYSSTQIFIDGLEIFGHRLFGLPPTEPTYVCNWDFNVGRVTGECSIDFLHTLSMAFRCFALSFEDAENALPPLNPPAIHDVTFLRARLQPVSVGLQVDQAAFLVSTEEMKLQYNDWAGPLFSDRLYLLVPELTLTVVDAHGAPADPSLPQHVPDTLAYMKITVELSKVKRKQEFNADHLLQQGHIALHDSRTHRVPWLILEADLVGPSGTSARPAKPRPPAMMSPHMPEPVSATDDYFFDGVSSAATSPMSTFSRSASSRKSSFLNNDYSKQRKGRTNNDAMRTQRPHERWGVNLSQRLSDTKSGYTIYRKLHEQSIASSQRRFYSNNGSWEHAASQNSLLQSGLAFSSPYKQPYFPLLSMRPDLRHVPILPERLPADPFMTDAIALDNPHLQISERDSEQSSFILNLNQGVQVFCTPEALSLVTEVLARFQTTDAVTLLDTLQVDVTTETLRSEGKRIEGCEILDFRIFIPWTRARFVSKHYSNYNGITHEQYDITLDELVVTARSSYKFPSTLAASPDYQLSVHILLSDIVCSARESVNDETDGQAVISLAIKDPVMWVRRGTSSTAEMQFEKMEIASASRRVDYISSLIRQTLILSEDLADRFSKIERERNLRLRLLVLLLTIEGRNIVDPPFLTRASYVSRSRSLHLRTTDSWKIMSRLRYIYRCLSAHTRCTIHTECVHKWDACPPDAGSRVAASFDHWRTLDSAHVQSSLLLQRIYGQSLVPPQDHKVADPFRATLRAGGIYIVVDPGPSQNEIEIERLIVGIALNQPVTTSSTTRSYSTTDSTVQAHCAKVAVRLHWALLDVIGNIFETIQTTQIPSKKNASRVHNPRTAQNAVCMHIIVSFETSILGLETQTLKIMSLCHGLKASIMFMRDGDGSHRSLTDILVNADVATSEIWRHSSMLTLYRLRKLSAHAFNSSDPEGAVKKSWKLVGIGQDVHLQLLANPLELIEIADRVLKHEVAHAHRWLKSPQLARTRVKSLDASQQHVGRFKAQMGLSFDSYLLSLTVFPSLTYQISGTGAPSFARLILSEDHRLRAEIDLKEHLHTFRDSAKDVANELSTLGMPHVNICLSLDSQSSQNSVVFNALVERIALDASSVFAILTAVNTPEILRLRENMSQGLVSIQDQYTQIFEIGTSKDGLMSTQPILYDAYAFLVGLDIHTSTPDSLSITQGAELQFSLGQFRWNTTNRDSKHRTAFTSPELEIQLKAMKLSLLRSDGPKFHSCGNVAIGAVLRCTSKPNDAGKLVRSYEIRSSSFQIDVSTDTASGVLAVLAHLRGTLRTVDLSHEVQTWRKLGNARLRHQASNANLNHTNENHSDAVKASLFNSMYSLEMTNVCMTWRMGNSLPVSLGREPEDLVLSFTKIDFSTHKDNAARLLVQDFQLQMVPISKPSIVRSPNSALLPELVFNVAYVSTDQDRRLAFQAAGKSLDLRLTSQFILPANDLRRSIALAIQQVRNATSDSNASAVAADCERKKFLGNRNLTSLLVAADFAGAVVHIQGRSLVDPHPLALNVPPGGRLPQHGRYNQVTPENASNSSTTLRAPGFAFKLEYRNAGHDEQTLNAEMKVDASSNILYPTVVPLIMEISSSVKDIVGERDDQEQAIKINLPQPKILHDERLRAADPIAIFGTSRLKLGLRICRQEFSLSCQPIARVAATACFEDIYITVNTVQTQEHGRFFTISAAFTRLQASVQHVYSRESTGNFEVDSIVMSLMNRKHVSTASGISAILSISPTKAQIIAKQLQDFLLFREIWMPPEIRRSSSVPAPVPASESQAFIVQRCQQIAAAGAFPWNAIVSIAELDVQLDLGQSLGKSAFVITGFWISSKKTSDWEQNLCLGFKKVAINSTGRMSGFVDLNDLRVRTSIKWPVKEEYSQTPLVQASLAFDHLRIKASFEYQAFLIANVTTFEFLMYNVRDIQNVCRDRLVGVLDGDKMQIFCTTTSASQAIALYQAFQRLYQEKMAAYETSLRDIEKYLRRKSSVNPVAMRAAVRRQEESIAQSNVSPLRLQTNVVITLKAVHIGSFPSTFFDNQILKLEAFDASARFAVVLDREKIHATLGMTLGQLRVALASVTRASVPKMHGEVSMVDIVGSAMGSRGGTILRVPKLVATMETWQSPESNHIDYIFKSSFQGKVDVGWNYSRISYIRGMWTSHARALAQRLGKPLPQSALQITGGPGFEGKDGSRERGDGKQEKITAIVNVPQSKYHYTALQAPIIETPQLRDMGEATPPLEWIGLHRDRLPNLTHQIVIVTLLEVAKEVDDAYSKILGSS